MQVALVLFTGVSVNECEAFTLAFRQLPGCQLVGVGARIGEVVGPGGRQRVEQVFADVPRPDVVLVPGGLGVDRTAHDEELLAWLRAVEPTCQWMAASSTGTVVVAAAGLLGDHPAATHWLAGRQLAEYGSEASPERIVEVGHIVTCHGHVSAADVALLMILRLHNREIANDVRVGLAGIGRHPTAPRRTWFQRVLALAGARVGRPARVVRKPINEELITSVWLEMELAEDPDPSDGPKVSPWDRPGR